MAPNRPRSLSPSSPSDGDDVVTDQATTRSSPPPRSRKTPTKKAQGQTPPKPSLSHTARAQAASSPKESVFRGRAPCAGGFSRVGAPPYWTSVCTPSRCGCAWQRAMTCIPFKTSWALPSRPFGACRVRVRTPRSCSGARALIRGAPHPCMTRLSRPPAIPRDCSRIPSLSRCCALRVSWRWSSSRPCSPFARNVSPFLLSFLPSFLSLLSLFFAYNGSFEPRSSHLTLLSPGINSAPLVGGDTEYRQRLPGRYQS
ncbi:hypothetical protein DFH09DRAFT_385217 [Mycena vulgaris]|nr:hypothetical protein DFH09DRAFT_385217 [Mycena vulgaris]